MLGDKTIAGWWFGCHFLFFPYLGNFIIPIDFHIFQRGGPTTNQIGIYSTDFTNKLGGVNGHLMGTSRNKPPIISCGSQKSSNIAVSMGTGRINHYIWGVNNFETDLYGSSPTMPRLGPTLMSELRLLEFVQAVKESEREKTMNEHHI